MNAFSILSPTLQFLLVLFLCPLPVGTDQVNKRTPWVTHSLIFVNVLLYCMFLPDHRLDRGSELFAIWGLQIHTASFWNFITYAFIHVSVEHLFWNMIYLWIFGPHVEEALGSASFSALYFGGAVAAGLLHTSIVLLMPASHAVQVEPLVGASGAISAILAPYAVRFHRSNINLVWVPGLLIFRNYSRFEVSAIAGIGIWLADNLFNAFKSIIHPASVAYWAHIGGFVFGLATAELTNLLGEGKDEYLLADARIAASDENQFSRALDAYIRFLLRCPADTAVRAELARLWLAESIRHSRRSDFAIAEAGKCFSAAIVDSLKAGQTKQAVEYCEEALVSAVPMFLSIGERLHLASAAEQCGTKATAATVLERTLRDQPSSLEDGMISIRLARLLRGAAPERAKECLMTYVRAFPDGNCVRLARELLEEIIAQ